MGGEAHPRKAKAAGNKKLRRVRYSSRSPFGSARPISRRRPMNWRKSAYLSYASARGYRFPALLASYSREYERGANRDTTARALEQLLRHCRDAVPHYADWLKD